MTSKAAGANLLHNPGLEETASNPESVPGWSTTPDSGSKAALTLNEVHGGKFALAVPARSAVVQKVEGLAPGAYLARCWVKSASEQPITVLLQDPDRPWAAYTCAELVVPRDQWTQVEAFCPLDRQGSLSFTLGGMSSDFRFYHGAGAEMESPIVADDFELIRNEPRGNSAAVTAWDAKVGPGSELDWSAQNQWSPVRNETYSFASTPVLRMNDLAGVVRADGSLALYSAREGTGKPRGVITPVPALPSPKCTLTRSGHRTGVRIGSPTSDRSYVAWFAAKGLVSVDANHVSQFQIRDCRLRYGLLPSFAGTDLCYDPAKLPEGPRCCIPSTQWFVGLADGNDSMLVAVWENGAQAVSLGLSGAGENRLIDSLSIGTEHAGFSLGLVEHPGIWHKEALQEDWLGEYVPIKWERPFPARWMSHFFVTPGGAPNFREPFMDYSFPAASAKTRQWGVWFEDWNHYPFFFDGPRTILHFEKTFVPNGDALFYFLEPAAADLVSPCEIVEQALGAQRASVLFDFDANRLRRLKYSTPNLFMYDRPVCATTTRLSKIKQEEKTTVGVNLATHLYEFIREIRARVDQYSAFFNETKNYLAAEQKGHPELGEYVSGLDALIDEAQARSAEIYQTTLPTVEKKIEAMKQRLREGKGDGFECGNLDVRDTAGDQDDLCRRYNRWVMRLAQTAAFKCGDSPEKAIVARRIWEQSRAVLREPTRWESRRTLYFFEP